MSQQLVLKGISSMATKAVLAVLTKMYQEKTGVTILIESVGGIDAAKRIQSGEAFDVVLLASDAIERLIASGHLQGDSRHDWVLSPVAVAVPHRSKSIDISSEDALKNAVLESPLLSYSTGPSGVYLEKLFERWGVAEIVKSKLVVPPPGTPVGKLISDGLVALGFQQLSELISIDGIDILGTLPNEVSYITTFSSGIPVSIESNSQRVHAANQFLEFLASNELDSIKAAQGMTGINHH